MGIRVRQVLVKVGLLWTASKPASILVEEKNRDSKDEFWVLSKLTLSVNVFHSDQTLKNSYYKLPAGA